MFRSRHDSILPGMAPESKLWWEAAIPRHWWNYTTQLILRASTSILRRATKIWTWTRPLTASSYRLRIKYLQWLLAWELRKLRRLDRKNRARKVSSSYSRFITMLIARSKTEGYLRSWRSNNSRSLTSWYGLRISRLGRRVRCRENCTKLNRRYRGRPSATQRVEGRSISNNSPSGISRTACSKASKAQQHLTIIGARASTNHSATSLRCKFRSDSTQNAQFSCLYCVRERNWWARLTRPHSQANVSRKWIVIGRRIG